MDITEDQNQVVEDHGEQSAGSQQEDHKQVEEQAPG